MKLFSQYRGVYKIFRQYWSLYGGLGAILTSPYFHFSVILALVVSPYDGWADQALEIMPNILGFSLGGYAILLAFSNERFLSIISSGTNSAFLSVSSTFAHFIFVQISTILFAFTYGASPISKLPDCLKLYIAELIPYSVNIYHGLLIATPFIGLLLLIYSLTTALAATMSIFRMSIWYNKHLVNQQKAAKAEKDRLDNIDSTH